MKHPSTLTLQAPGTRSSVVAMLICVSVAFLWAAESAVARDTMQQVRSTAFHLGVGGAWIASTSALAGQAAISFPLDGLLRGLKFQLGVDAAFKDEYQHFSIPIALRYVFMLGSPVSPYIYAGTGYFVSHSKTTDHGFEFFSTGAGVEYYFTDNVALGLGFDLHTAELSMKDSGNGQEVTWIAYGLKLSFSP